VASQNGHLDIIQLLLSDPRVNPADNNNGAIRYASKNGHLDIVQLLLSDPRVLNSLSPQDIRTYQTQIQQQQQEQE